MSLKENDVFIENIREHYEELIADRNFSDAHDLVKHCEDYGFNLGVELCTNRSQNCDGERCYCGNK